MVKEIKDKIIKRFFNDETQNIASAALMLGIATLTSSLLGVIRQRLLIGAFGVGGELDAYFAAFQIPNFAYNLLISATLSVAFIPVFCEYLNKDKDEAWKIANSILNLTITVMGLLSFFFFLGAPYFVKLLCPGFSNETYLLTVNLTRILMLSPLLFSISSIFSSILNSFRSFFLVALAPLLYNTAIILGIIFLAPTLGIYGVAIAVIAGAILHILIQIPGAVKFGFKWRSVIDLKNNGVREIVKLIVPRILAIDSSQISQIIGTFIGSMLTVGSVAIFNLVYSIESLPIGIFAVSFVVSVFPSLSSALAKKNFEDFKRDFSYTARQILFFLIPLSILTFIFRAQIIRLIMGTKNLDWQETRLAAGTLAIFAGSFIFQGLTPLLSRAFFALKNTTVPLLVSLSSIVVNVLGTFSFLLLLDSNGIFFQTTVAFLKLEGIGDLRVLALPFGFSIASLFNAVALFLILKWKFGHIDIDAKKISTSFLKYLSAGLVAGISGYLSLYFIEPFINNKTFLGILAQLSFSTFFAVIAFVIISLSLRSEEMIDLIKTTKNKIGLK
ncbi:MAG: murein biosynthesis integral membrane protein MurJ [bacterium]